MKVAVEPHNPEWEAEFRRVRDDLGKILKDVPILSIEHVGSTSIPGLLAKPVLDIDIVVTRDILAAARAAMVSAGYTDLGEKGISDRIVCRQPGYGPQELATGVTEENDASKEMRRSVYVTVEGSLSLKNHRDLKRVLLEDAALRDKYGQVKKSLAAQEFPSVDDYCRGKNEIMLGILKSAGWDEEELEEMRKVNE
jgi:GrpB-like predicted nucleotidyltransferase (UPF0157 family)